MSIFDRGVKVSVNGVEVSNSPVTAPIEVEVRAPLPPLPMRQLAPFIEHPICARCGCKKIGWQFWPRYHTPCPDPFHVAYPRYPYIGYGSGPDPREFRDYHEGVTDADRVRVTQPAHHDLSCTRCQYGWVIGVLPEDCE